MQEAISKILFPDRWFFGGETQGIQGDPARHLLMIASVALAFPADRPMRILEIGSWIGFSALTWAQAIGTFAPHKGTVLCVDPWTSYFSQVDVASNKTYEAMDFMGRSGLAYDLFRHNVRFCPDGVTVDHIRGVSANVLPYLERESFDLIFIDGSHYYDDVLTDLKLSHALLREGGIMCGDDLELQASQCDMPAVAHIKSVDYVVDPKSGEGYHPGVTLAVDEFFGPVSAARGFWYMRKTGAGYEQVPIERSMIFIPEHFPDTYKEECEKLIQRTA